MNSLQVMRIVKIPLASQEIMTGIRIGLSGGWISLIAAEMLGSNRGLGFSILMSANTFRFADIYSSIVIVALIGLAMNYGLFKIQAYIKRRF
jgi:NitT/TauT family transport system permease protein